MTEFRNINYDEAIYNIIFSDNSSVFGRSGRDQIWIGLLGRNSLIK